MSKFKKKTTQDPFSYLISLLGQALWAVLKLPFRGMLNRRNASTFNQADYRSYWEAIESKFGQQKTNQDWSQAVIDADKLFDRALRDSRASGETFADRLKASEAKFSSGVYQAIWDAHKLRNAIAHEVGFQINYDQAKRAANGIKSGLQSLGALS